MNERITASVYRVFVEFVEEKGDWVGRKECAQAFDVHPSTATYHLEKAVQFGALEKQPGFIGNQPGWIYGLPGWQLELPF
jgi:hypothetical protein